MKTATYISTLTLLLISANLFGTNQLPDILIFENDTLELYESPLLLIPEIENQLFNYTNEEVPSNCYRGFVAEWKIIDSKLYLSNVFNPDYSTSLNKVIEKLLNLNFSNGLIEAIWISDTIWTGKNHINGDYYPKIYESEYSFIIEKAQIIEINNYKFINCDADNEPYLVDYFISNLSKINFSTEKNQKYYYRLWTYTDLDGRIKKTEILDCSNPVNNDLIISLINNLPCRSIYFYKGEIWTQGLPIQILLTNNDVKIYVR